MRFLGYTIGDPSATPAAPPTPEEWAEMSKFIEEATKAGVLLATGGVGPIEEMTKIVRTDGKITVIDGPFTESKELFVGWSIFEAGSREEAIEGTRKFLEVVGDGQCELRQITEGPDDGECGQV
jgi:hypothetical protein